MNADMDWAAIVVGALGAAAVAYTAWNARRTKDNETAATRAIADRPDWSSFSTALERRVEKQDVKIDELFGMVAQLRTAVDTEKRVTVVVLRYLREVLAWASPLVPEGQKPPRPPSEISDELRYWLEA